MVGIVAQGTLAQLLSDGGTQVRAGDMRALGAALTGAGLAVRELADGGLLVEAGPEEVGRAALAGGVALTSLGPAGGRGLEQLFFNLTDGGDPSGGSNLQEAA
jgi:ABC-2 type transport system ATP-binding protein